MTRNINGDGLNGGITDKSLEHSPSVVLPRPHSKPSPVIPLNPQQWSTANLPWRITSDITAAACASGLVAPLITIIDRYTPQSA